MVNPAQIPTGMSTNNQQNSPEYPHFALIYIDRQGNLRHESSLSVANSRETILSPLVTDEFLRAVQRSSGATPSHSQCKCHIPQQRYFKRKEGNSMEYEYMDANIDFENPLIRYSRAGCTAHISPSC